MKAINKYYQSADNAVILSDNGQQSQQADSYIYVKADKKVVKILLQDILFIESLKDYVHIYTLKKSIITKNQIGHLEEKLPADKFVRIHKSYIVAIAKIEAFTSNTIEINNKELPIGRSYKNMVLKTLNYPNKKV